MANTGLFTTASGSSGFLPKDYAQLIERPVAAQSIALRVSTLASTVRSSMDFPILDSDATASWTKEGQDITVSNPALATITCTPSKLAGLVAISSEMANDSDPASAEVVGRSLARSLAKAVDAAFFAGSTTNGPAGIESITPTSLNYPNGGFTDLDPLSSAISEAEQLGYQFAAFVTDPDTKLALLDIKDESGSNRPLLGVDPANPTQQSVFGVPLLGSADVTAGTVYGIPREVSYVVQREGIQLEVDRSVYFGSDRVAVRAVARYGFAFPHAAGILKLTEAAA